MPVIAALQTKSSGSAANDVIAGNVLREYKENALTVLLYYSTYFKRPNERMVKETDIVFILSLYVGAAPNEVEWECIMTADGVDKEVDDIFQLH